jgi:misacylated tRNA(Ala) deacylase
MTDKLYLTDAYVKEFDAEVTAVGDNFVSLDKTSFYPTSGGQPCDTGTLQIGDIRNVVDVKKSGEDVIHLLNSVEGIKTGDKVHGKIDWDRRYAHMRYHTALHVIDALVMNTFGGKITGGQIYTDRARIDLDVPGLDREKAESIIKSSQELIDRKLDVTIRFLSKEEALNTKELARTKPGKELLKSLSVFRVIAISGLDMQLDGGTHVSNTGEIGKISLSKYESRGAHNKRIEVKIVA